jgi:hypothetical protein
LPSFSDFERKEALETPSHTDQRPLALHRTQAAQQELAEALQVLDDAEDGLGGGFALSVAGLAGAGAQALRIRLGRCRLTGRGGRVVGEPLRPCGGLCRWRASGM